MADWKAELAPHYATAERMLGVTDVTFDSDALAEHTIAQVPPGAGTA